MLSVTDDGIYSGIFITAGYVSNGWLSDLVDNASGSDTEPYASNNSRTGLPSLNFTVRPIGV